MVLERHLRQVALGDKQAFRQVYALTSGKLYGICLRILVDAHEAEDALQDAFLTIWRKSATFDPTRASPMTWLMLVTRSRALDRLRSRRSPSADAAILPERFDDDPAADSMIELGQELERLRQCLDELEPSDSGLVRTAFLKETSYSELAGQSGLPLGTVKSRIRRALLKLRGCLAR